MLVGAVSCVMRTILTLRPENHQAGMALLNKRKGETLSQQPYRFSGGYSGSLFLRTEQGIKIPVLNASRARLPLEQPKTPW